MNRTQEAYIRHLIREELVKEISVRDVGHVALDLVGLIPGIGEIADVSNAVWYAKEGNYFNAVLSLISIIPEIGDAVGKGGRLATWLTQKFPKVAGAVEKWTPEITMGVRNLQSKLEKHSADINKLFKALETVESIKPHIPRLREALQILLKQIDPKQSSEAEIKSMK